MRPMGLSLGLHSPHTLNSPTATDQHRRACQEKAHLPPTRPPLLSLPPDLLALVVSLVEDKDALRLTCRALRLSVGTCTTTLTWRGISNPSAGAGVSLTAVLPALCSNIRLLDCSRMGKSLVSLAGCPPTTQVLIAVASGCMIWAP